MIAAHASLTASRGASHQLVDVIRLRRLVSAMADGAVNRLGQTLCALRGHAMMLHFESTRLSLHCAHCGRTTPGWAIETRAQTVRSV